jgi:hypothetical protein
MGLPASLWSHSASRTARRMALLGCLMMVAIALIVDTVLARMRGWNTSNSTPDVVIGLAVAVVLTATVMVAVPRGRRWLVEHPE